MGSGASQVSPNNDENDDEDDNEILDQTSVGFKALETIGRRVARASAVRHDLVLMNVNSFRLESRAEVISSLNAKLIQSVEKKIKMTKPTYITKRTLRTQEKEIADLKFAVKLLEESKAALVPMKNQVASLISTYEAELAEVTREVGSHNKKLLSTAVRGASALSKNKKKKDHDAAELLERDQVPSTPLSQVSSSSSRPQAEEQSTQRHPKIQVHVHHNEFSPSSSSDIPHVMGEAILPDSTLSSDWDTGGGGGGGGGGVGAQGNARQWEDHLSQKLAGDLLNK